MYFPFINKKTYTSIVSGKKYLSKQTSVSTTKNETNSFPYPAVTFCVKFKDGKSIVPDMVHEGKVIMMNDNPQALMSSAKVLL